MDSPTTTAIIELYDHDQIAIPKEFKNRLSVPKYLRQDQPKKNIHSGSALSKEVLKNIDFSLTAAELMEVLENNRRSNKYSNDRKKQKRKSKRKGRRGGRKKLGEKNSSKEAARNATKNISPVPQMNLNLPGANPISKVWSSLNVSTFENQKFHNKANNNLCVRPEPSNNEYFAGKNYDKTKLGTDRKSVV